MPTSAPPADKTASYSPPLGKDSRVYLSILTITALVGTVLTAITLSEMLFGWAPSRAVRIWAMTLTGPMYLAAAIVLTAGLYRPVGVVRYYAIAIFAIMVACFFVVSLILLSETMRQLYHEQPMLRYAKTVTELIIPVVLGLWMYRVRRASEVFDAHPDRTSSA